MPLYRVNVIQTIRQRLTILTDEVASAEEAKARLSFTDNADDTLHYDIEDSCEEEVVAQEVDGEPELVEEDTPAEPGARSSMDEDADSGDRSDS